MFLVSNTWHFASVHSKIMLLFAKNKSRRLNYGKKIPQRYCCSINGSFYVCMGVSSPVSLTGYVPSSLTEGSAAASATAFAISSAVGAMESTATA